MPSHGSDLLAFLLLLSLLSPQDTKQQQLSNDLVHAAKAVAAMEVQARGEAFLEVCQEAAAAHVGAGWWGGWEHAVVGCGKA